MSLKGKVSPSASPFLKNAGAAPIVYFDNAPVRGTYSGNIEVELAARMLMPKPDGSVVAEMSCTAHLRCSPLAARILIEALANALDILAKQPADEDEQVSELLKN